MEKVSNYTVLIEQDEDGLYVAKVPDIIGCYTLLFTKDLLKIITS